MSAEDMILAMRICGNHPDTYGKACGDCPWMENCNVDGGGSRMALLAADIMEGMLKLIAEKDREIARLRQELPEECFEGMS